MGGDYVGAVAVILASVWRESKAAGVETGGLHYHQAHGLCSHDSHIWNSLAWQDSEKGG